MEYSVSVCIVLGRSHTDDQARICRQWWAAQRTSTTSTYNTTDEEDGDVEDGREDVDAARVDVLEQEGGCGTAW